MDEWRILFSNVFFDVLLYLRPFKRHYFWGLKLVLQLLRILIFCFLLVLFVPWPIYFILSLKNLPPHTLSVSSSSVSLSIFHSLILFFCSRTNCLPLRPPLPCHLATFLFSLSLRQGWQSANICMPSHVVCIIFYASCVPASIFS